MKIGFDISQTGASKAGCGYYAHAMIHALVAAFPQHEYVLYPSFGDFFFDPALDTAGAPSGAHVHLGSRQPTREAAGAYWNAATLQQALDGIDVLHANNFWCPAGLPRTRVVYTLYDIGFVSQPWWTTEANRLGCFNGVFRAALHADWLVAISQASRDHFLQTFPYFPHERVVVIYPCSRFSEPLPEGSRPAALEGVTPGRYWLNVGTIEPRKNQARLAAAYAHYLAQGGTPMPLVLAGGKGWLMDDFVAELRRLGIERQVVFTGYVSDDELVWLYRHCGCNVYPSLFEGFGLPVLEGMQLGAPTIAADTTSIPEVCGDAALLVDPMNPVQIAEAMLRVDREPGLRERLGRQALQRAAVFDWRRSASELEALYHRALAEPKRSQPLQEAA